MTNQFYQGKRHWAEGLNPELARLIAGTEAMIGEKHYTAYRATEDLRREERPMYGTRVKVVERER
jgi:hypothetical protein